MPAVRRTPHPGRVRALLTPLLSVLLAVLLVGGCTAGEAEEAAAPAPPGVAPGGPAPLELVDWAVSGPLLSVLVRNGTDQVLRRADMLLQALDAQGRVVATSTAFSDQTGCCTAFSVPPGAVVGFYFPVDEVAGQVADVQVDPAEVAWAGPAEEELSAVRAEPLELRIGPTESVALAELYPTGARVEAALVQARIDDPAGELVAVISGRWSCLQPQGPQRVDMQLPQTLPADSRLASVSVFPVDPATTDGVVPDC